MLSFLHNEKNHLLLEGRTIDVHHLGGVRFGREDDLIFSKDSSVPSTGRGIFC